MFNTDSKIVIVKQVNRVCKTCNVKLDPLSSMCVLCKCDYPFEKVEKDSYYEHFELKTCPIHGRCLYWCIHPAADCTLEDLKSSCVMHMVDELRRLDAKAREKGV